jgi:hypothetical protein
MRTALLPFASALLALPSDATGPPSTDLQPPNGGFGHPKVVLIEMMNLLMDYFPLLDSPGGAGTQERSSEGHR